MLVDGCISAYLIFLHECNQVRLSQISRWFCLIFFQLNSRGELIRNLPWKIALIPFIERVYLEIVLLFYRQVAGFEPLLPDFSQYLRLNADSVSGAAGQKMARNQIIDFPLSRSQSVWICGFDGVDWRMGLVILFPYFGLHKSTIQQLLNIISIGITIL